MRKIIIIGSPGSGKSTFARKLRDQTGLPLHHLDMIWHHPDGTTLSRTDFDTEIEGILESDEWIVDGNYDRTLEMRLEACDTVFLMDIPVDECLDGAMKRINQKRDDIPWVEEKLDEKFRQHILDFPREKLPRIYELLCQYDGKREIHIFRSRAEADGFLENLR